MRRVAIALAIVTVVAIASLVAVGAGHDSPNVDRSAFQIHGRWCQRARNDTAADAVLAGKVMSTSFGTVTVGTRVDWSANPFHDPSWQTELQSLDWLTPSIVRGSPADVTRVRSLLKSWIAANPWHGTATGAAWSQRIAALRARVLLCAGQLFRIEPWWQSAIETAGDALADQNDYAGYWNHGLDQDISLVRLGCALGRDDWLGLAEKRGLRNVRTAIAADGVDREQSFPYAQYTLHQVMRFTEALRDCGRPVRVAGDRVERLRAFLAYATRPDGQLEQIGDGDDIRGDVRGPRPAALDVVYPEGYVFGRTGWTRTAGWYTLRFGPPPQFHGHADHTALTYMRYGHEWLIDAGSPGYKPGPYRNWVRSPAAHNVVVVDGAGAALPAVTTLVDSRREHGWQSFVLRDRPYRGVARERRVLHVEGRDDFFVVADDVVVHDGPPVTYQQLWHLSETLSVAQPSAIEVTARSKDGARTFHVIQVGPRGVTAIVRGATSPLQGWRSRFFGERQPVPTIVTTRRGRSASYVTVLVDARAGDAVSVRWITPTRLRVDVGGVSRDVVIGRGLLRTSG